MQNVKYTVIAPNFDTIFTQNIFFWFFSLGTPLIKIHECMSKIGSFAIPKPKTWFSNGKAAKKFKCEDVEVWNSVPNFDTTSITLYKLAVMAAGP